MSDWRFAAKPECIGFETLSHGCALHPLSDIAVRLAIHDPFGAHEPKTVTTFIQGAGPSLSFSEHTTSFREFMFAPRMMAQFREPVGQGGPAPGNLDTFQLS